MGIEVVKVHPQDFEKVYLLLQGFRNASRLIKKDWQNQFSFPFGNIENYCGYMLLSDNEPVGFLGLIFSQRQIHGKQEKFCDLAAWIVKDEFRSNSLALIFPLLREKNLTITTFTASNRVVAVLKKLGFKDVETQLQFLLPVPSFHKAPKAVFDLEQISVLLTDESANIFRDHKHLNCWHVTLETPEGICYIMLNRSVKKRLPVAYVDYISDRSLFEKYIRQVIVSICRHFHVIALVAGDHFGIKRIPFSIATQRNHPILYRSGTVNPEDIDLVYSEIQVLGLLPT
jgi:hypothetical protein